MNNTWNKATMHLRWLFTAAGISNEHIYQQPLHFNNSYDTKVFDFQALEAWKSKALEALFLLTAGQMNNMMIKN